jgi:hypothetical protein
MMMMTTNVASIARVTTGRRVVAKRTPTIKMMMHQQPTVTIDHRLTMTTPTSARAVVAHTSRASMTRLKSARRGERVAATHASSDDDVVVVPGDYRIGGILIGVALFTGPLLHLWTQFLLHGALGGFLAFQASRVRFRFTKTDLEVVFIEPGADDSAALAADVASSGDNKLQGGGENRWSYDSITNWEFWWPGFPCLVYFKETQTKSEGQPHFFPIIMDGKKLYEVMLDRMPASQNAKPSIDDWSLDLALEQTSIGRQIKENLTEEQLKQVKELKGFPVLDDK